MEEGKKAPGGRWYRRPHSVTREFKDRRFTMPLSYSKKGEGVVVKHISGSETVKKRLENLGFTVGGIVTVVSDLAGNLIVTVKDSRIALNRELANHIFVSV
jgi:ferrous iron transport protein A